MDIADRKSTVLFNVPKQHRESFQASAPATRVLLSRKSTKRQLLDARNKLEIKPLLSYELRTTDWKIPPLPTLEVVRELEFELVNQSSLTPHALMVPKRFSSKKLTSPNFAKHWSH